jgi:hypothetical protein
MDLQYFCPNTNARFFSTATCSARIAKAQNLNPASTGTVTALQSAGYEFCAGCTGPVRNGKQVAVTPKLPKRRAFGFEHEAAKEAAKERRKLIKAGKPIPEYKPTDVPLNVLFRETKPNELWTGKCGCTRKKSEWGPKHYRCAECLRADSRNKMEKRRRAQGIEPRHFQKDLICTVEGCGDPAKNGGMRSKHYQEVQRRTQGIRPRQTFRSGKECSVEGCDSPARYRGLCRRCYQREQRRINGREDRTKEYEAAKEKRRASRTVRGD